MNRNEPSRSDSYFRLPNGANRSPDVAWVSARCWSALSPKEQEEFSPLCPEFVIELRSKTDGLKELRDKMQAYLENGCRLGWLINPQDKQVEIYRIGQKPEAIDSPLVLSGEEVLPSFRCEMKLVL